MVHLAAASMWLQRRGSHAKAMAVNSRKAIPEDGERSRSSCGTWHWQYVEPGPLASVNYSVSATVVISTRQR